MSLTRKMLKAMGIDDEKIDQIIEAHSETVDALKTERDGFKENAAKLPEVQKQLDEALETVKKNGEDAWKDKYDDLKKTFDDYKLEIANSELRHNKEIAYSTLLKELGVSEKRIATIVKVSDVNSIELNDDGTIKNVEALKESIKTEWSDFIVSQQTQGASTSTPPGNAGVNTFEALSLTDKMAYANAHPNSPEVTEWLNKN